jgi:HlyD family secretion protein
MLAPLSGTLHQLAVHTIGAVVSPSDVLMLIVPSSDQLVVEVQIRPSDIDQLSVGQATRVRFSALTGQPTSCKEPWCVLPLIRVGIRKAS